MMNELFNSYNPFFSSEPFFRNLTKNHKLRQRVTKNKTVALVSKKPPKNITQKYIFSGENGQMQQPADKVCTPIVMLNNQLQIELSTVKTLS